MNIKKYINRIISYISRPRIIIQEKPVIINREDYTKNPIFIVGVHRSGTSLLRRIFNSHPNVSCPPETFFLSHYTAMLDDNLVEAGYSGFGYDRNDMIRDLAIKAPSLHEAYRKAKNKRRWADKTPQYVDILDKLKILFPNACFVLIYRHPFDITFSIFERGWRYENSIKDLFDSTLSYVGSRIKIIIDFERKQADFCCRIFYEDLVFEPEKIMTHVFNFVGEKYDSNALKFSKKSHNYGLEDPMIRGTTKFQPSIDNWKSWPKEKKGRARDAFGKLLNDLGYSLESSRR